MNLSNILFNNISNNLNLTLLKKEKCYIQLLFTKIDQLKQNKKKIFTYDISYLFATDLVTVCYIINITFLKANTTIHLSDIKGNTKLFYSTGDIGFKGKRKKQRKIGIIKLISLFTKKIFFTHKNPIALHLNNVKSYKRLIIRKLKKKIFLTTVKSFNLTPYNGCRKKIIRRKKRKKKFK
jgi:ribosomal protein S11